MFNLKHFCLKNCTRLSFTFYQGLALFPSIQNLRILDLTNNDSMDDTSLKLLAKSKFLLKLEEVYLDSCDIITDKGFDEFVKS